MSRRRHTDRSRLNALDGGARQDLREAALTRAQQMMRPDQAHPGSNASSTMVRPEQAHHGGRVPMVRAQDARPGGAEHMVRAADARPGRNASSIMVRAADAPTHHGPQHGHPPGNIGGSYNSTHQQDTTGSTVPPSGGANDAIRRVAAARAALKKARGGNIRGLQRTEAARTASNGRFQPPAVRHRRRKNS